MEEKEIKKKENEKEYNTKKRMKEERSKKKDDKRPTDQHLRILNHISSTDDKLDVMCKKYSQAVNENKRLSQALKHSEKKVESLLQEREELHADRNKGIIQRKRLESLCRELQKQNKVVKTESLQRVKEQEEIRKDLSEKFQGGLAQITTLMNQNIEKNAKMYEENLEINKKFKEVYEQVEQKEQQLLKVHQQMKVDLQIADAKLAKVKMEATAEKETLLKEKQELLLKMTEYQTQIKELQTTEIGLRSEISMYTDKYDEFQNALNKSNKIYNDFNAEMEKMANKMFTLEKETTLWKQRWATSHNAHMAMTTDKQARDAEMATLSKKLTLLQNLCRMFQCERTKLLAQLRSQNDKSLSPEPSTVPESQEIVKYMKQMDDLPNLENTFDELQVPQTNISEIKQETSDMISETATTKMVNGTAKENEKLETAETKLDKGNIEQLQTTFEDVIVDSSEDCDFSKSKEETATIVHIDSTTDAMKIQEPENNNQESFDAIPQTILGDTCDTPDKSIELLNSEEIDGNSQKQLPEALRIEEISKEVNEVTESSEDVESNDKSVVVEEHAQGWDMNDETEVKKQTKDSEQNTELSVSESKVPVAIPDVCPIDDMISQEIDQIHKKEIDLLRNNADDYISEELESQTIEDRDDNSRTCGNGTNEIAEENKSIEIAHRTSNATQNGTLLKDLTQDNSFTVMEKNVEAESSNNSESITQSTSTLIETTAEILKTNDLVTTTDEDSLIENKSKDIAETANIIKNNSQLVDNTENTHPTEDILSISNNVPKEATEATSLPIEDAVLSKKVPVKTLTSESNCTQGKLRKLAPKSGKRRKKLK